MKAETFTLKARLLRFDFDHYTQLGQAVYTLYALDEYDTLYVLKTKAGAGFTYKLCGGNLHRNFIFTVAPDYSKRNMYCNDMVLTEEEVNKIAEAYND